MYGLSVFLSIPFYLFSSKLRAAGGENLGELLVLALCSLLLIPNRTEGTNLFGLNVPYWSLFVEMVANVLYAAVHPFLSDRRLVQIVIFSAGIVIMATLKNRGAGIGYSTGMFSLAGGLGRGVFGFFMGLLLHRHILGFRRCAWAGQISPWVGLVVVAGLLASPDVGVFNPVVDLFGILFAFPACVLIASQQCVPRFAGILIALGSASYPLYVLHYPIAEFVNYQIKNVALAYAPLGGIMMLGTLVTLSLVLEKYFDIPVRRRLTSFVKRNKLAYP